MLKKVHDLPDNRGFGSKESYVAKDVREFCRNRTYDVAELTVEGKSSKQVYAAIKHIKKNPDKCKGIGACMRNGRVYLYREVER